ncbi:LuxR C-terminal-related transcriptional regulator [Corynebacterium sp. H128]|uniref:helix-turn-helix transcriptional regulator n=1 Tax=Corynebacterium sp. H128 TaxID=3133427 RepID=UPI0030B52C5F
MIHSRDDAHALSISGDPRALSERIQKLQPGQGLIVELSAPAGSGKRDFLHHLLQQCPGWFTHRIAALPWLRADSGNVIRHLLGPRTEESDALQELLDADSAAHLIVIDDAHWADDASIRELATMARRLSRGRLALILSVATEDGSASSLPLTHIADYSISLPPLTLAEVHDVGYNLLGISLSASICTRLLEMSGGRPGRVRELLSTRNLDYWRNDDVAIPVPPSWQQSLATRTNGLSPQAHSVLECLGVFRDSCPLDLLQELSGDRELEGVDELVHAAILHVYPTSTGLHAAVTNPTDTAVIQQQLSPGRQARLHGLAADYFTRHNSDDQALIHRALSAVGCRDTYALLLADRGTKLGELGAWQLARRYFDEAAALASNQRLRQQLRLDAVEAVISASDIASASVLSSGVDPRLNSQRVDSMLGGIAVHEGRRAEAKSLLEPLAEQFSDLAAEDPVVAARLGVRMTLLSIADWDAPGVVSWAARTREVSPAANESGIEAAAISLVGSAALSRTHVPEALRSAADAPFQAQRLSMAHGWVSLVFDDPISARDLLRVRFEGEGSERIALWQDAWLARANFLLGDWPAASAAVERGLFRAEQFGIPLLKPLLLWTGAHVALYRGDRELTRFYSNRLVLGQDSFAIQRLPSHMSRLASASLANDVRGAVRAGEQLMQIRASLSDYAPGFWPWEDVFVQALLRDGQTELATTLLEQFEAEALETGIASLTAKLAVPRGNVLFQQGEVSAAMHLLDDAVDCISALPLPAYESRIVFEYGQLLRRFGQRRRADEMFGRATELFTEMGADAFVSRALRERRAVGLGPRHHAPEELTPQELEIARLVARGATNRDVAAELYLSVKTVEYHLTRVYRKLRIRRRNELPGALRRL